MVLALIAAMVAPPLGATAHADDHAFEIVDGVLDWGIKASFRSYVEGPIAGGSIATSEGAQRNPDGTIRFVEPEGRVDDTVDVAFTGTVQFTGHNSGDGPLLDLTISSPTVTIDGDTGTLAADVSSRQLSDPDNYFEGEQVTIATLDLDAAELTVVDEVLTIEDIPATLTADGAEAFAGFYGAGEELDPLTLAVDLDEVGAPIGPAELAIDVIDGLDPEGQVITVTGSGFDPTGNLGTRPPLAGRPGGVYVAVARIGEPWAPSAGAPTSARRIIEQRWALPAASIGSVPGSGTLLMEADGSFVTTLEARIDEAAEEALPDGSYAVIVYAGSGAVNPTEEFAIPLTFASEDDQNGDENGDDENGDEGDDQNDDENGSDGEDEGNDNGADGGATTGVITDGVLDWGIKASFRNYIEGPIAGGSIATSEGAQRNPDGTIRFVEPEGRVDDTVDAAFTGTVQFTGHNSGDGPLLDLTISSPTVTIDGDTGTLAADVSSRQLSDPDNYFEGEQVTIATLDLTDHELAGAQLTATDGLVTAQNLPDGLVVDGVLAAQDIAVTLTADGAEAFADFYDEGEELDPLSITLILDDADATLPPPPQGDDDAAGTEDDDDDEPSSTSTLTTTSDGSLPRTGGDALLLLAIGLTTLLAGAALVTQASRRRMSAASPQPGSVAPGALLGRWSAHRREA